MRHAKTSTIALAAALTGSPLAQPSVAAAQAIPAFGHNIDVSRSRASLRLDYSDDSHLTVLLAGGRLFLNGREAGRYMPGGPLERAWRGLLEAADTMPTAGLVPAMRRWKVDSLAGADLAAKQAIENALRGLTVASTSPGNLPVAGAAPEP